MKQFLKASRQKKFWKEQRVICFRAGSYPLVFFRLLFDFLKENEIISVDCLRFESEPKLWGALQQSFLGESSVYWLGDISVACKKKGAEIVEVLSCYRGPHKVIFFMSDDTPLSLSARKRVTLIEISNRLSLADAKEIFAFFGVGLSGSKGDVLAEIFKKSSSLSLETICMLKNYFSVTSNRLIKKSEARLIAAVEPELSLTDLSHAFFEKNGKLFFSLWSKRCNDFSIPFWIAFWSEQVWRAYFVTTFLKNKDFYSVRRFSYRLPASFTRSGYKKTREQELIAAYEELYNIDFAFKNGSTFCSFDLFFNSYFLGNQ